jgi:hypothetical protein
MLAACWWGADPMTTETTRRALLGAAVLTIPVAAVAHPIICSARREWDSLIAEFHRADAAQNVAEKALNVAETHYFAEHALLGERPKAPDVDYPRPIRDMTIGELRDYAAPVEKLEAYDATLAAWEAKSKELEYRTKRAVEDRWHDALDKRNGAAKALFAYPAPDRAALLFKLDLAEREYHGPGIDLDATIAQQLFADMRRFARGEA